MSDTRLQLRLFVAAASDAEARDLLESVVGPTLAPKAYLKATSAERYWKIPEWYELTLDLEPLADPRATFDRIVGLADAGWTPGGDSATPDAVWNATQGVLFLAPEVRWAHLQLWPDEPS